MMKRRATRQDTPVILCEPYGQVCDAGFRARTFDDRRRMDATLISAVGLIR